MAETFKGVYGKNTDTRDEHLSRNNGKYAMYNEILSPAIGELVDVHEHEGNKPTAMDSGGLLKKTVSNESELGKELNNRYWRNPDDVDIYGVAIVPSEFMQPYHGRYENYLDYVDEIGQLSFTKQYINKLATWDLETASMTEISSFISEGTNVYDALFSLNTYGSMALALEPDRPGIVRHFSVDAAILGSVITNVNNNSGKDTRLGEVTSDIVGKEFKRAYQFNTLRKTRYITEYLRSIYGANAYTIHNLTYNLVVDDTTGRLPEIDDNTYITHISTGESGNYGNWVEYQDAEIKEQNHYDTAYNRYQNLVTNYDILSKEYKDEHYIYNPFDKYLKLSLTIGKSIENPINVPFSKSESADLNGKTVTGITHYSYNEGDQNKSIQNIVDKTVDNETYQGLNELYQDEEDGLLYKTHNLFTNRKIGTLVGRFHTSTDTDSTDKIGSPTQSSFTTYGMSHGRNLLTEEAYTGTNTVKYNGYDDPYCRVWTYHHQYYRLKDAIRPFRNSDDTTMSIAKLQGSWGKNMRTSDGAKRLSDNSVLNSNGMVNIVPKKTSKTGANDIRRCMFSIENLAWKDVNKQIKMGSGDQVLSPEQIGPNGGRIMWFPPYDLKFNENVTADWKSTNFLGRGEPIYTYNNTIRKGTLSFTILVDHPSIVDSWRTKYTNPDEDQEQELLRFFAGCGILEPGTNNNNSDSETDDSDGDSGGGVNINPITDTATTGQIIFYTFFPNNYSGYGDMAINAIDYLLKGHNNSLTITDDLHGYEMTSVGITDTDFLEKSGDKWGYRIDDDFQSQILNDGNYEDFVSYNYNAKLSQVTSIGRLNDANCTLAEIYTALDKTPDSKVTDYFVSCGASTERINKLKTILEYGEITSIDVYGGASKHGYKKINESKLAPRRGNTLISWLYAKLYGKKNDATLKDSLTYSVSNLNVCASDAKAGRFAKVVINFKSTDPKVTGLDGANSFFRQVSTTSVVNTDSESTDNDIIAKFNRKLDGYSTTIANTTSNIYSTLQELQNKILGLTGVSGNGYRYDYEREYFENLSVMDPVMHHKIVDKIKYFDPAFHSITPEGFNARLTFLHQCTRQGHTISASDGSWSRTAGNMAFGRPPVCVLRLGDFFNTKVVIQSLNITYDDQGMQWDLNQEGIGVQPMRARIELAIDFIGGSDLAAPVTRLQNAVSFNYYANTSVYDNRSDVMKYDEVNHEPTYAKTQWVPTPTYVAKYGSKSSQTIASTLKSILTKSSTTNEASDSQTTTTSSEEKK